MLVQYFHNFNDFKQIVIIILLLKTFRNTKKVNISDRAFLKAYELLFKLIFASRLPVLLHSHCNPEYMWNTITTQRLQWTRSYIFLPGPLFIWEFNKAQNNNCTVKHSVLRWLSRARNRWDGLTIYLCSVQLLLWQFIFHLKQQTVCILQIWHHIELTCASLHYHYKAVTQSTAAALCLTAGFNLSFIINS